MKRITLRANGICFPCLSHGEGRRSALLVHGLFDDAGSMQPLMVLLARAGFKTLSPYMRGYGGTASGGAAKEWAMGELARDVLDLVREFSNRQALLVGHGWGGLVAYAAANMEPRCFSEVVLMGVPPTPVLLRNLPLHPALLRKSWYRFFLQFPFVPESVFLENDCGVIDKLWREWNPGWHVPLGRLAGVKTTFHARGTASATLACCRHLAPMASVRKSNFREGWRLLMRSPVVPTLVLAGRGDGCFGVGLFQGLENGLKGRSRLEVIEGCGHFMHLTHPEHIAERILEFAVGCESSAQVAGTLLRTLEGAGKSSRRRKVSSR